MDRCPTCKLTWVSRSWQRGDPNLYFVCGKKHEWSRRITFAEHGDILRRQRAKERKKKR